MPEIKPDYQAVKVPGNLSDWHLDPLLQEWIEGVYYVYVFNRNEVTHLCSADQNYWLVGVYTIFECPKLYATKTEVFNLEYIKEEISVIEMENPPENDYFSREQIDKLPKENFVDLNPKDGNYEDYSLDDCLEYVSGNYVL